MKSLVIGASWFLTHGYCEYKFYLEKVLHVAVPENEAMVAGSFIHKFKEEEFLKEADIGTWDEFLQSEQLTITKEVALQKKIGDVLLMGVIDEIVIDKDSICIIEDKPKAYPFSSVKRQIAAYCHLFKENFSSSKKLIGVLRDRDSSEIVWQHEYNIDLEKDFILAFHRLRRILLHEEEPVPTENYNKCKMCRFNKICEHSLV